MLKKLGLAVGVAATLVGAQAAAAGEVGVAKFVRKWAYHAQPNQAKEDLYQHDAVRMDDSVWTVPKGAARLVLDDGTELRLGPDSEVTIDEYVYDPATNEGEAATDVLKGTVRYISGEIDRKDTEVETPTVVIGLRGTRFDVSVADSGATRVDVIAGMVEVVSKATGDAAVVAKDESLTVSASGEVGEIGEAQPARDDGLNDAAGVAPPSHDGGGDGGDSDNGGGHGGHGE